MEIKIISFIVGIVFTLKKNGYLDITALNKKYVCIDEECGKVFYD